MEDVPAKNGHLILVVEDDQAHRESLTVLLEQEGYEVNSAADGLHAMERLRWGLRPRAILLDMRMHVMNGWEFRRELKRDPALASIPVLVMSGGPVKDDDLAGSAGWIAKPVRKQELLQKIGQCVDGPQTPSKRAAPSA